MKRVMQKMVTEERDFDCFYRQTQHFNTSSTYTFLLPDIHQNALSFLSIIFNMVSCLFSDDELYLYYSLIEQRRFFFSNADCLLLLKCNYSFLFVRPILSYTFKL
jgi:hypothetical protein